MSWLKDLFKEIKESREFPNLEGFKNLNNSKSRHHRRIGRMLLNGDRLTAVDYSDLGFGTKLGTRINELEESYGYPLMRERQEGVDRWYYRYSLDFNKLNEMEK